MSVTFNKPEQLDELTWRLSFTSDQTPPVSFRVVREGVVVASFTSSDGTGEYFATVPQGDFPAFEVLDRDALAPAVAFPGRLTLHWAAVSGAVNYRVEELVGSVWTLRMDVPDDGAEAFSWQSRWLEDTTTHQFRILAEDAAGNASVAASFSILMVRHPDPPNVSYSYDAGTGKVTIAQSS